MYASDAIATGKQQGRKELAAGYASNNL